MDIADKLSKNLFIIFFASGAIFCGVVIFFVL
jgi:hypothetical protein